MWKWSRNQGNWKSKYFTPKEFQCTCNVCSRQIIDEKLVEMLDEVRDEVGLPITITSAFRCDRRQEDLRKQGLETATGRSSHQDGIAVDMRCGDMKKLEAACLRVFANYSVGIARSFVHVDLRAGGPRRWGYTKV